MTDVVSLADRGDADRADRGETFIERKRLRASVESRLFGGKPEGFKIGRFTVLEPVGSGGMGIVYAAYDPELDRRVAIKVLQASRAEKEDSDGRVRLLREAKAMAQLTHPNVVSVYDTGTIENQVYIVMEFCEGETLKQWLERGLHPWRAVLERFLEAARGLAAAHHAGLVHRDFKPENVILTDDGRVIVVDFGLARAAGSLESDPPSADELDRHEAEEASRVSLDTRLTRAGFVMGTPAYMSPEQARGQPTDAATDQFSYCVSLYEGLCGVSPFPRRDRDQRLAAIAAAAICEPSEESTAPRWLARAMRRGLADEPDQRYPSMDDVIRELSRDPARTRRRFFGSLALTGAVIAAAYGYGRSQESGSDLCGGSKAQLASAWGDHQRELGLAAFVATNKPYAADVWDSVVATLDEYAANWVETRNDACRATHVRGEQSSELLDLRMVCLERRLAHLETVSRLLAEADDSVVANAFDVVDSLPPLADCSQDDVLRSQVEPPPPGDRDAVEDIRKRLAEISSLSAAGRYAEAFEGAQRALDEAERVGYVPLLSEARYRFGVAQEAAGDHRGLEEVYYRAALEARATNHAKAEARAWTSLAAHIGTTGIRPAEALRVGRMADACIASQGGDVRLETNLIRVLGRVHVVQGHLDDAMAHQREALRRLEDALGPDDRSIAPILRDLATALRRASRHDESLALAERAKNLTKAAVGASHPNFASTLEIECTVFAELERTEQACECFERVRQIRVEALGADHRKVAGSLNDLGVCNVNRGRYEVARGHLERALEIYLGLGGEDQPHVAITVANLGSVYRHMGDWHAALAASERALSINERAFGTNHPLSAGSLMDKGIALRRLGRLQDARIYYLRSLAVFVRMFGSDHQRVAAARSNLGTLLLELDRPGEALTHADLALAAEEAVFGPRHAKLLHPLLVRGRALADLGRGRQAVAPLERAIALADVEGIDHATLAETRFILARTLMSTGGDTDRAVGLVRKAEAQLAGDGAETPLLERVRGWLRRHGN